MNVLEVFTGNPLSTPVGQRIEKATDGSLASEDWALNMEICDIINETDEGPRDAIKAVRKKLLNVIGKDWKSVIYCLVVLETCVKNCGRRFHLQVANKEFLQDLLKIISPKNDSPVQCQEKVLGLIQIWSDAFKGSAELKAVELVYQELKQKGIEFPPTDLDNMAPIHTPKGSVEPRNTSPVRAHGHTAFATGQPIHRAQHVPTHPPTTVPAVMPISTQPTAAQMSKLRADIDAVQGNCRVFNEMLNIATPGSSELAPETVELMKELNRTCRSMQQRIVILIEQLADEQVTEVLLRVNDDLNNAFLRYDRLERYLNLSAPPRSQPQQPAAPKPAGSQEDPVLIDFGSSTQTHPVSASALAAHVNSLKLTPASNISNVSDLPTAAKTGDVDEFDAFIQSRKFDSAKSDVASSYAFQSEAAHPHSSLGAAAAARTNPYSPEADSEASVTSSEFDRFLEERAAAGERLPDRVADGQQGNSNRPVARQLKKDDSENALFSL